MVSRVLGVIVSLAVFGAGAYLVFTYYESQQALIGIDPNYAYQHITFLLKASAVLGGTVVVLVSVLIFLTSHIKVVARKITYSKTREIAFSRERFRRFYELSPVPYLLIHSNGIITRPNKASLRLFGLDEAHIVKAQLFDFLSVPDDPNKIRFFHDQVKRNVPIEQKEVQINTHDGQTRWVLFSAELLTEEHHGGADNDLLVTLVDIHEQKELERIKTEFLSLASHQLRAPLANLKWYIDFLLKRRAQELTKEVSDYLQKMYRRNEEMIDLVNTLLNLSRVEMGRVKVQKEPSDIADIVKSVVEELEPEAIEKHIQMQVQIPETLPYETDGRLLRIIVQNLLTNAFRYTPAHGSVSVKLSGGPQSVVVEVADTGVGIPPEEQGRIFSKMYRATNARVIEANGNGIGLYMCKALAEALDGSISFTSELNKGTSFRVTL